jgi:hypothetical protein
MGRYNCPTVDETKRNKLLSLAILPFANRHILVLGTSIFMKGNMGRRE